MISIYTAEIGPSRQLGIVILLHSIVHF